MTTWPLLPELASADDIQAYRQGRAVSRAAFLRDVAQLAARLPEVPQLVNLCSDRYHFAVALCACISRSILSLLPNSTAPEHLNALIQAHPGLGCLVDPGSAPPDGLPCIRIDIPLCADAVQVPAPDMPRIPAEQRVACVFTSGSTGTPQAHVKRFGRLNLSVQAAARRLWALTGGPCAIVGTPTFRHMFGLESTVLLALLGGGRLSDRLPFFPADVAAALAEVPAPRLLVTTPFHLRKLLESGVELPPLAAVLSATAPLSHELACQVEAQWQTQVLEIYGATEVGQLALRRTSAGPEWQTLDGIRLQSSDELTVADGAQLEMAQPLADVLDLRDATHFRLVDRHANLINIVGKRTSLSFLNHLLNQVPGVRDGVFHWPRHAGQQDDARLAAFVVAPTLGAADIVAALRPHLDPVFLPRPLVMLNELPRDANGKVLAATLDQLAVQHLQAKA